jgi:hypothetical protein
MNIRSFASILLTSAATVGGTLAGCSSSNPPSTTTNAGVTNPPSTTANAGATSSSASNPPSGGSSSSLAGAMTTSASTGTGTSAASSGTTEADSGTAPTEAGAMACVSGLEDKVTTCTATSLQQCTKGCGPDLPAGSSQTTLGTKTCTCTAGVYDCGACAYESPLPLCYQASATASMCAGGVADKLPCTTPCTTGTGNDVCTTISDAGKAEDCVCIMASTGNVWTCATSPW